MSDRHLLSRVSAALAALTLAASAHAGTDLTGTGTNGDYTFTGSLDNVFTISLDAPGTYDFSSLLSPQAGSARNYNFNTGGTYLQVGDGTPIFFDWTGKSGSDTGEFTIDAPRAVDPRRRERQRPQRHHRLLRRRFPHHVVHARHQPRAGARLGRADACGPRPGRLPRSPPHPLTFGFPERQGPPEGGPCHFRRPG